MNKLTLEAIEPIFREVGISREWLFALTYGQTVLYNGDTVLNWHMDGDICIINSGSIGDAKFCKSILKDIKKLIELHDKVVISSTVSSIERYLAKYDFSYYKEKNLYTKGLTWASRQP